jgi:nucleoid-associated protein YgaU
MSFADMVKDVLKGAIDPSGALTKAKEIVTQAHQTATDAQANADAAQQAAAQAAAADQATAQQTADQLRQQAEQAAEDARQAQEAHDAELIAQGKAQAEAEAKAKADAAAKAAAAAAAELRTYTVVSGDTLSGIGERFGVNWHKIAELNHIANPDLIYPGQVFKIPHS